MRTPRRLPDPEGESEAANGDASENLADSEPLRAFERLMAGLIGGVAGSAGGWAVFSTNNQAGSAVLLLVGAAFVLMALQGTALIRFGAGENLIEYQRRRRVQQVIEQAEQEDNPIISAGLTEAASIIEPRLLQSITFRSDLYVARVGVALQSTGVGVHPERMDYGRDFMVVQGDSNDERVAHIVVKYRERGSLDLRAIRAAVRQYETRRTIGVLVVTNAPLSDDVKEENTRSADTCVEAVTWVADGDTHLLARALLRVLNCNAGQ